MSFCREAVNYGKIEDGRKEHCELTDQSILSSEEQSQYVTNKNHWWGNKDIGGSSSSVSLKLVVVTVVHGSNMWGCIGQIGTVIIWNSCQMWYGGSHIIVGMVVTGGCGGACHVQ